MNNQERAEKLLKEAKEVFEELSLSYKRGAWNLCIRRSQEVVELVLKGILNQMGIEYPKEHDVAPLFKKIITEKRIEVDEEFIDWLILFSSSLAEERAPAFYFEDEYNENDAKTAMNGAEKVLNFGMKLMERLQG